MSDYDEEYGADEDTSFIEMAPTQENGLPTEWGEAKNLGGGKVWVFFIVERFFMYSLAILVYWLHVKFPSGVNTEGLVVDKITSIQKSQLGFFYLAGFLFVHIKAIMGYQAVKYREECPLNAPDQYVHQIVDKRLGVNDSFVLLAKSGAQGAFNRAQRAVANMDEYAAGTAVDILLVGPIFPFMTLIFTAIIFVFRATQVPAYASNPGGRVMTFMVHIHVIANIFEGLLLFVGIVGSFPNMQVPFSID
jgi:hypothetical protein